MELKYFVRDGTLDLSKMGPKFLVHGLQSHKRSSPLPRIDIPGIGGAYLVPGNSDFATLRQVFRNQAYDIVIKEVADRLRARHEAILKSGKRPVIIDAGANIGAASLWFQQQYPEALVAAVEPDSANVQILRKNVVDMEFASSTLRSAASRVSLRRTMKGLHGPCKPNAPRLGYDSSRLARPWKTWRTVSCSS